MGYSSRENSRNGDNRNYQKPRIELNSENYVDKAEKVIRKIKQESEDGRIVLSTSKIRNILTMVADLYNDVLHETDEKLKPEFVERIQYLRLRIAYEAGREEEVKKFVNQSGLLRQIQLIGNSRKKFLLFAKYMEALVAYHRYYGGEE